MTETDTRPVIDGYDFVRPLGTGGHSVVLLYRQRQPQRLVAVKVLTLQDTRRGAAAKVVAEANKMAMLVNHGHIVSVLASAEDSAGRPYIVMSYCPGEDLWTLVKQGPFDVRRVLRIGAQIADALAAAHARGIVHRDVKPANILIDEYRSPRLTDFGISVLGGSTAGDEDDGVAVSLPWAPPEVLSGQPGGAAGDVYCLGATLWNLLTGRMPFDRPGDNSPAAMEARILAGRAPRTGRADVSPAFEDLLARMLARDPADRPGSADVVARELERIEVTQGGPVRPDHPWHAQPDIADTIHRPSPAGTESAADPAVSASAHAQELADEDLLTRTKVRRAPALETRTQRKAAPPVSTPAPAPAGPAAPARRSRWIWAGAAVVVAAVAVTVALTVRTTPQAPADTGQTQASERAPDQDAGAGGDAVPPGVPAVTGLRLDQGHARFTWTYSAPYDTDTFLWQTGTGHGTAAHPTVDVDATGQVCLQVKVIRADGRNGTLDWSPKGCVA